MTALPARLSEKLMSAGLDPAEVERVVRTALAEDLHLGPDVTTLATIGAEMRGEADLVARAPGVVAGLYLAEAVFDVVRPDQTGQVSIAHRVSDGDRVNPGDVLMSVQGPLRAILTGERTALNLLTHMSGIASLTRLWADAVAMSGARVRDTRKTLPGLRVLEKYAVRCGGGVNHRMSLGDAALIKDNHVAAAGSVAAAYLAVRQLAPDVVVEVECDSLEQVVQAVGAGADLILLDNFGLADMCKAVDLVGGRVLLEASGGLRLEMAAEVAATGVDYLAVGALTHSAPALDIGLDVVKAG
jgi:nicotinate-nucleotide pyrophosphorylase (carboxylating)